MSYSAEDDIMAQQICNCLSRIEEFIPYKAKVGDTKLTYRKDPFSFLAFGYLLSQGFYHIYKPYIQGLNKKNSLRGFGKCQKHGSMELP